MTSNWLWPALFVEDSIPREADLAAADAVDLVASVVDGQTWLRRGRFSAISYGILFARVGDAEPMRIRQRRLVMSTRCHPDRLTSGDVAIRWMFFSQVLRDLGDVGKKYGLGDPPLRISPLVASEPSSNILPPESVTRMSVRRWQRWRITRYWWPFPLNCPTRIE